MNMKRNFHHGQKGNKPWTDLVSHRTDEPTGGSPVYTIRHVLQAYGVEDRREDRDSAFVDFLYRGVLLGSMSDMKKWYNHPAIDIKQFETLAGGMEAFAFTIISQRL